MVEEHAEEVSPEDAARFESYLKQREAKQAEASKPKPKTPEEEATEHIENYAAQAHHSPANDALVSALRALLQLIAENKKA